MFNVEYKVTGSRLVIEVDMSKAAMGKAQPSATGKTRLLASTRGAQEVPGTGDTRCSFSLNVMLKP